MKDPAFKSLTLEDFGLSEEDMKIIVGGAQQFLPPDEVDTDPESQTS